jgi:hypothetical protein
MDNKEPTNQRRIGQWDILPKAVKQRACEAWLVFSGLEADLPTGETEVKVYFCTDSNKLKIWNETAWVSTTLS